MACVWKRPYYRWAEAAPELTGRTDGNKRVVFPDRGVIDGLGRGFSERSGSPEVRTFFCRRGDESLSVLRGMPPRLAPQR